MDYIRRAAQAQNPYGLGGPSTPAPTPANFRIPTEAFTASIFTFLAIAVVVASTRIYLRLKAFRRLNVDDYFMIAAVIFFAGSTGATQASKYLMYLQMSVEVGAVIPDANFGNEMLEYTKWDTAEYMLQWSCIYCVKFSYIFFFRPLTSRLRPLRIWWWILVIFMTPTALITICISPWVCPHYDASIFEYCIANGSVIAHERIILKLSTATDITTDLLVISIPIWLLTTVKLELKRKLALGAVLCLSVFMIAIAITRYAFVNIPLPDGSTQPDTVWLFFWQSIESVVSIIMVSLTAFRSLYGQERARNRNNKMGYEYVNESNGKRRTGRSNTTGLSSKGISRRDSIHIESEELSAMEKAPRAHVSDHYPASEIYGQALGSPTMDQRRPEQFV